MRVWLVSSWGNACGIAEHSVYLKQAIEAADPAIQIEVDARWLDPGQCASDYPYRDAPPDWLILNYHRGLHSRWTPEHVRDWQDLDVKVCVIFHDTVGERPPDALALALHDRADLFVVHEPCEGLPRAKVWRQGVPTAECPALYGMPLAHPHQPIIGTVGFPFPWKNYDLLAEATAEAGCALLLIAPGATPEQVAGWQARNPHTLVRTDFVDRREVVGLLSGCDATAFLYACANTGTSAAIRLGVAARRPVLATRGCRQFRDLQGSDHGRAIYWTDATTVVEVAHALGDALDFPRVGALTYLAEHDGWHRVGRRYAAALRGEGSEQG